MAIDIDPKTGLKRFTTRAAASGVAIKGKGYSTNIDASLKTLPPAPQGAVFDAEEQSKYREFKEARRGAADYMRMEGEFSHYLQDHYTAGPVQRESLSDCLLYTSPSPRDRTRSRMPSSA